MSILHLSIPRVQRLAVLLLPIAVLAACTSGEKKNASETSAGDVAKPAWSPANLIDVMRINIIADFAKHVGLEGVAYARWRLAREIASMAPKHEWYYE